MRNREFLLPPVTIDLSRPISPGCPSDGMIDAFLNPYHNEHGGRRPRARSLSRSRSLERFDRSSESNAWRIQSGAFIAFKLDRATVAALFPQGTEAYDIARELNCGIYTGLVTESYMSPSADGKYEEELVVHFVSEAPPRECGTEGYWMPIAPTSVRSPRTALESSFLFPFQDLMVWTTFGARLKVETFHESSLKFQLYDDDELARFDEASKADQMEQARLPLPAGADVEWRSKCSVPEFTLPAEIWRDIRVAEPRKDPDWFPFEVDIVEK